MFAFWTGQKMNRTLQSWFLATYLCLAGHSSFAHTAMPTLYPATSQGIDSTVKSGLETEWAVESYDAAGLWLVWKNSSAGKGAGELERSAAIAITPGSRATATLVSLDGKTTGLTGILTTSSPARYRDVEMVAILWTPQIPSGQKESPNQARIRIDFKASASSALRTAFAPPADNPAELALSSWLINYTQSRNLRSTPATALGKSSANGPSAGAKLPKERLVIKTRGENIEVIDYATLVKSHAPISKIDPRKMRLYHDGVEIPVYIQGEDDGVWNPGDFLEFIGKRSAGTNSYNSFYTVSATFILTWEGNRLGLRAPRVPVASRTGGVLPIETQIENQAKPFSVHEHIEDDVDVLRIGSSSVEEIIDLGSRVQETELTDFWFWKRMGADKDAADLDFKLDYTPSAQAPGSGSTAQNGSTDLAGSLRVTINLKGITNNPKADPDHHLKFILNGTDISLVGGVNHDAIWEGQESYTWVSPPINPAVLKAGANKLTLQKVNNLKTGDGQLVENQDAYVNFIEFDFPATYKVANDNLRFSNSFADSLGTKLFTLNGFTTDEISMWDTQGRKLANFRVNHQGDGYQVSFLDSLAGSTSYIACASKARETPSVVYDTLPNLLTPSQGADYLIITQENMLGTALDSLVDYRRKQGLRCAVVMANHIYQAFGDGSLDPAAIRRFVAYAYQNWPRPAPLYLCLVGDATLWFEKRSGGMQFTTVPTHLVNIRGWGVAANDDFFAKVSGDDDVADLMVGRIPASSVEDLGRVVHKTILLESSRPEGHWRNKTFLISGFESSFMTQNYVLQAIAAGNDRQISRLDLFPGSPHYKSAVQRINFFDQIDSSFNLVSFIGHGGGAVWSDAGVLTLKALDEGRLQGEFPIPLVSSITCLTGYFEDVSERSLGEELIRMSRGGAAGFYGASGYISNLAGEALSAEILKAATGNAFGTTGAIVNQAETMVKLRTGDAFLPVMAEFNLLGDPALHFAFPTRKGNLSLKPQALAGKATLKAQGSALNLDQADGLATVYLGDSTESSTAVTVSGSAFTLDHTLKAPVGSVQNGKVVVNYWSETQSQVVSAPFSTLDWLIDSIAIKPANAAPGDSVSIQLKLNTAYSKVAFNGGVVSYVIGGELAPLFPGQNQSGLQTSDGIHLETVSKVVLDVPQTDLSHPRLYLAFRLNVQVLDPAGQPIQSINSLSSRTYSLPLSDLASLELVPKSIHLPIQQKLGLWVVFHNRGLGTAVNFKLSMVQDAESASPRIDTLTFPGKLAFGGLDSIFFPLAGEMLNGKRLRASLIASRDGELAVSGRSQDTIFHVQTRLLASQLDTLHLDTIGTFLTLGPNVPNHRIFSRTVTISSLPTYLSPASGSLPIQAFLIESEPPATWTFNLGATQPTTALPKTTAVTRSYWHYSQIQNEPWVKMDTISATGSLRKAKARRNGLYALLNNSDVVAPIIQISSRGQILLPDDYVPLHTPIDVTIRDGQGVDFLQHPPEMTSREQVLDSLNYVQESGSLFPTLARINFLPKHKADTDSLVIAATDISGNVAKRSLIYRLGDDLAIRNLGSYPNPFADTATFVFSLTDYCEKVDLKIYSRSGRMVRSLSERNVVGYQEVVWDGRAEGNKEIANGLYFLKVIAKAGKKESTRIFKLFKKQRK